MTHSSELAKQRTAAELARLFALVRETPAFIAWKEGRYERR